MKRYSSILFAFLAVVLVGAYLVYMLGNHTGQQQGDRAKARLELVWPDFSQLPADDRAVLAGYSLKCRLFDRPLEAAEVVACLRDAAAHEDSILPKGMTNEQAKARLENLISDVRK